MNPQIVLGKSIVLRFFLILFGFGLSTASIGQTFEVVASFANQAELNNANGIAVADYDLDGDLDIYIVASEKFDEADPLTWSRLLRNDGALGFTDVTLASNLINFTPEARTGSMGSKMGASWGDYDNDGYPDIFLSNYGYDELWHNEGNGQFTNVTDIAKVHGCFRCYSANGVWWDYDQDGDLDLYVSDWIKENRFYRNDGNHNFTDISIVTGLNDPGQTWTSLPYDLDQDGLLDLYVINDVGHNRFYKNLGNDDFQELTETVGLIDEGDGMGVAIGDYNNDGLFDIYLTNIHHFHSNPFFINNGNGTFSDQAKALNVENTGWGWGARLFDMDHDLDEDLYVVNGFDSPIATGDQNMLFENNICSFSQVGAVYNVDDIEQSMGLEVFDFDEDGDCDMLVGKRFAPLKLYKNKTVERLEADKNWLKIALEGTNSNRNAFGSILKIRCEGKDFYRYYSGVNLMGQSIQAIHFGLKNHLQVDEIEIIWPSGQREYLQNVAANQLIHLKEGSLQKASQTIAAPEEPDPCKENQIPTDDLSNVTVYPNPIINEINLAFNTEITGEITFTLSNTLGQIVYQENRVINKTIEINIQLKGNQALTPGVYFYHLNTPGGEQKGALIK